MLSIGMALEIFLYWDSHANVSSHVATSSSFRSQLQNFRWVILLAALIFYGFSSARIQSLLSS